MVVRPPRERKDGRKSKGRMRKRKRAGAREGKKKKREPANRHGPEGKRKSFTRGKRKSLQFWGETLDQPEKKRLHSEGEGGTPSSRTEKEKRTHRIPCRIKKTSRQRQRIGGLKRGGALSEEGDSSFSEQRGEKGFSFCARRRCRERGQKARRFEGGFACPCVGG